MYKVVFNYKNGKKGVCIENGEVVLFKSKSEATAFAENLNNQIAEELKDFFPVWSTEKA